MAANENVDNLSNVGQDRPDSNVNTALHNVHPQPTGSLTGEDKKIFDAAFVGVIIGAGLTALLFACM